MQTNTELELERQRSSTLSGETDLLSKQIDRLQDKLKNLFDYCPRDVRLQSVAEGGKSARQSDFVDSQLLRESQRREENLQGLLREKDQELKSMQQSLSSEMRKKDAGK